MITTLFIKIFLWMWNFTPNDNFIPIFIVLACIECFIEIIALCMWIGGTK